MKEAFGQPPEEEDLIEAAMERMSLARWQVMDLLEYRKLTGLSIDGTGRPDEDESRFKVLLTALSPTPDDQTSTNELIRHTIMAVRRLTERHRQVITMRYGLFGHEEQSLREIGECMSLSYERVRQLEKEALRVLRSSMHIEEPRATDSPTPSRRKR